MTLNSSLEPRDVSTYGGCMLMIGLLFLVIFYGTYTIQSEFAAIAQPATGTVIEFRQGSGKDKGYYPLIQFLTSSDQLYTFESTISSNPPAYKVGDQVEILYNPEFPGEAVIDGESDHMMWFFAAAGIAFFLAGIYLSAKFVRKMRAARSLAR